MTNVTTLAHAPDRTVMSTPMADIEKLAEAVAKSGMFGIRTKEQALVLMAISQAEGRHPALAARDYHIIEGKPAKTAEAMQRDFLSAGGRIEWHQLDDSAADATFSHPSGGSLRIVWDQARVKQAGLAGRAMHQKYPRQMLRSRCVSEGIKSIYPAATSGMYVPEEVADYPAHEPRQPPQSVVAELDSFAGVAPAESERSIDTLRLAVEQAATEGREASTALWRTLHPAEQDALKAVIDMDQLSRVMAKADEHLRADAFGLPPSHPFGFNQQPSNQGEKIGSPALRRSSIWDDPSYDIGRPKQTASGFDWPDWTGGLLYLIEEASLAELDKLMEDNREHISLARRESGDHWREIRDAEEARRRALAE